MALRIALICACSVFFCAAVIVGAGAGVEVDSAAEVDDVPDDVFAVLVGPPAFFVWVHEVNAIRTIRAKTLPRRAEEPRTTATHALC